MEQSFTIPFLIKDKASSFAQKYDILKRTVKNKGNSRWLYNQV